MSVPVVVDLGLVPFEEARRIQLERLEARLAGDARDTLLLVEHPPVITLGRGTDAANVVAPGDVPVVTCERGGDVTLHAPGQLVGYVVRLLPAGGRDLHGHLRLLESLLIWALGGLGVRGGRRAGSTGVWVEGRKVASIGVACRRWCTWHGFALNVSTDLGLFSAVNPCGFDASVMTSVARETGDAPDMTEVKDAVAQAARELWPPSRVDARRSRTYNRPAPP